MMENKSYMSEVAKLLGLELNEEFDVKYSNCNPYKFTDEGLVNCNGEDFPSALPFLLTGKFEIIKKPWKPDYGDTYYYISVRDGYPYVYENEWSDNSADYELYHTGNFFRTEQEAMKNREAYKEFNKSLTPNMSWRIDW